jgi:hypothetical protein
MNICWYFEYLSNISIYQYLVDALYVSHGKEKKNKMLVGMNISLFKRPHPLEWKSSIH